MDSKELKSYLDAKTDEYNQKVFIINDPISIPHQFDKKEDIEIIGFIVATISWGNRKSIIKNGNKLVDLMNGQPHRFVLDYNSELLSSNFVHRTFNSIDLDFFLRSLQNIYLHHGGLEAAFPTDLPVYEQIMKFRELFLSCDHESRSEKHLANPSKGSSAKRINMFLRWMIRTDRKGVDFGLWKNHSPSQLYVPLDVHTGNTARALGLVRRKQNDWKALEELMRNLQKMDPIDPCKYDFALFGVSESGELKQE